MFIHHTSHQKRHAPQHEAANHLPALQASPQKVTMVPAGVWVSTHLKTCWSNWTSSPSRGETKTSWKPPPRDLVPLSSNIEFIHKNPANAIKSSITAKHHLQLHLDPIPNVQAKGAKR